MVKDKIKAGFGKLMKKMHKAKVEEKKKAAEAKAKDEKDAAAAKKKKDAEAKKAAKQMAKAAGVIGKPAVEDKPNEQPALEVIFVFQSQEIPGRTQ